MNFNLNKALKLVIAIVFLLNALLICNFILYPIVSADSGYYLAIAREFYGGKTYFVDIGTIYNPLAIITVGLPFLFNSNPDIRYHILINIGIIILAGFCFFKLSTFFLKKKEWNYLLTVFFVLLLLYNDGRYVILEPLSVVFQLVALIFYLNYLKTHAIWRLFVMGISISLAFLSKQYGLFIVLPIGFSMLMNRRALLIQLVVTVIGFVIPLAIFYFSIHNSTFTIADFLQSILGKGFPIDNGNGTGLELDFKSRIMFLLIFVATNLYLVLFPFYLNRALNTKHFLMVTLALFSSFTVLLFAFYQHYFIYVIPYFLLLLALIIDQTHTNLFQWKAFILVTLSIGLMTFSLASSFNSKKEIYQSQLKYASQLNAIVPPNSKVYLSGIMPSFYYSCQFNSIDSKKVSYAFSGYLFTATIVNYLDKGEYLVVSKDSYKAYQKVIANFKVSQYQMDKETIYIIQKE
jgi:hypothetical protein